MGKGKKNTPPPVIKETGKEQIVGAPLSQKKSTFKNWNVEICIWKMSLYFISIQTKLVFPCHQIAPRLLKLESWPDEL